MLQERWLLWKSDLYNLEMILLQGCNFQMGRLVYNIVSEVDLIAMALKKEQPKYRANS